MAKKKAASPAPASAPVSKQDLIDKLEQIAQFMEIAGENDFKVRAYRKGADAVRASKAALGEIASGAVKVPGVGEGLKGAMQEYLQTGDIAALSELSAKIPQGVLELMKVPGLGPKKAIAIQKELGVNSVGELEYACRENRLTTLKGFGRAIQEKILRSIEDMHANAGKIRLDEAMARAAHIERDLRKQLGKKAELVHVGPIGRHSEIVESIEFFITAEVSKVADAISALPWDGGLEERRAEPYGTEIAGYSGKLKDGCALTLWVSEGGIEDRVVKWLCADDNVRDEIEAKPAAFDGYEASWLELEWVDEGRVPSREAYRVAKHGKMKGIFHCHTDASDGGATLEEMVRAAEARGYEYIGISDHSQSAFYAHGLVPDRIREQQRQIKELQKKVSIKIFHGVESDILQDGALDYDEDILDGFDFIVGSIHSRFQMDEEAMTSRIVRALKNPHITMWGHPTGRLLLSRKGYQLDWDRVLDTAAACGVAVELNANPHRLDIDWRMGLELERRKIPVFVNPDAHSVEGLDDTRFGEYMAEKAMLPCPQILNLMGVNEMEKYLCERKKRARR